MENEDPTPKLPRAQDDPLFLHVPLACQVKGNEAAEAKVSSETLLENNWIARRELHRASYLHSPRTMRKYRLGRLYEVNICRFCIFQMSMFSSW